MTIWGVSICFGCEFAWANRPITNLPAGTLKVRRRIRALQPAKAYVKTASAVTCYHLVKDGENSLKLLLHANGINKTEIP